MDMMVVDTGGLPWGIHYEVIEWCLATFGPCKIDEWVWMFDDNKIYISEKNLTMLLLRWA